MGSSSTKSNNCNSSFDHSSEGDNHSIPNSPSEKNIKILSVVKTTPSPKKESVKRPPTKHELILIGEKQSGKTTLINLLKGQQSSSPLPTQYPGESVFPKTINQSERVFLIKEIDFEFYKSSRSSSIIQQKKNQNFIFLLKYDNNLSNLQIQIRNIVKLALDKHCTVLINNFTSQPLDDVKQEVQKLLYKYSIKTSAVQVLSQENIDCSFLSEVVKQVENFQITLVK